MTLTVENGIHQAMETWRRLGVEQDAAEEMAEEPAADLTAAAGDGRSVADCIGGDIEALATSWAGERGLLSSHRRLKETAFAAATGAAIPALAALLFWWVSWSHFLDPSSASVTTTLGGHVLRDVRRFPDPGVPLMWVGWVACLVTAFFFVRRAVAESLRRPLDPARDATVRATTKALPVILVAAALLGWAIGILGASEVGYYQLLFTFPIALVAMIGAVAAGAAWVRHRTCPPLSAIS
ncbi:hypothetical protein GCM10010211_19520 [Streptomyces albospinus]|uniref:Uncharacterized protein n=1 Tax=Streptomyces albospinus TaxID=285515 RepID=A0ABQ2UXE0_9ACTN|nr:hypothetical protein [Streptomyces albospinus]GGU54930.1 hypothetical protein GCM10010211_19520 [Streptomyces albospinus]